MPRCRAPIPSKGKQKFEAISYRKRSIELQSVVYSYHDPINIDGELLPTQPRGETAVRPRQLRGVGCLRPLDSDKADPTQAVEHTSEVKLVL